MMRDSLKHKTWMSSKMGKRNQMNNLLFHMDDTTMMRAWWDEKAKQSGLKGWEPIFCYPFYNERLFPLANPVKPK